MLKKYITKPREIQAIQYTGDNFDEIKEFVNVICDLLSVKDPRVPPDICIDFGGYYKLVRYGDYIFKNDFGKIVVVSKDMFEGIYEPKE